MALPVPIFALCLLQANASRWMFPVPATLSKTINHCQDEYIFSSSKNASLCIVQNKFSPFAQIRPTHTRTAIVPDYRIVIFLTAEL
jgi:hypothetical protein